MKTMEVYTFTEKVVCLSKRYQGTEMVGEVGTGGRPGCEGLGGGRGTGEFS